MATKMHAMTKYGPRISPGEPVHFDELVEFITRNTGQSHGETLQSVRNLIEAVEYFLRRGRSVNVEDFGTWFPDMGLDGKVDLHYRADPDLTESVRTGFAGAIENAENIGKTLADLVALSGTRTRQTPTTRFRLRSPYSVVSGSPT